MFKITIEDLNNKREKQTVVVGDEYAIFGTDPNKSEIAFSSVNASTGFMMNLRENIMEIITKSVIDKKCDDCSKKDDCKKEANCSVHTVDLSDASPELAKELFELITELKNMGHNPKDPIDISKMTPEFREKVTRIIGKMKKTENPFSAIADLIMGRRSKNPFH